METLDKPLVNRVAASRLVTIDLEKFYPPQPLATFDLKDYLFMGLILKEKDFREALASHNWSQYDGKNLSVFCSADAIIPVWAYMLVAAYAAPFANDIFQGTPEEFYKQAFQKELSKIDAAEFAGKLVIVKGCSDKPVPPSAYVELTRKLQAHARSIMFGEACSNVPIFKKGTKNQG